MAAVVGVVMLLLFDTVPAKSNGAPLVGSTTETYHRKMVKSTERIVIKGGSLVETVTITTDAATIRE